MKNVPYDAVKDFTAISEIGSVPLIMTVHPSVDAKTRQEFIAQQRADPKKYIFGTSPVGSAGYFDEFPVDKWDLIIALNLSSAFHTTRLALPGMKKRRWGRIVDIASAHALVASPFKSAYVSAKHGLWLHPRRQQRSRRYA